MVRVGADVNRSLERRAAALMQQPGEREPAQSFDDDALHLMTGSVHNSPNRKRYFASAI
jgi:hypothetical protein